MGFINDTARNAMLDELASLAGYLSVHSAYSTSGASEASGGSYARQAVTWASASGGTMQNSTAETWTLASFTARWYGLWSAVTSGTFYGMFPVGATMSQVGAADATNDLIYSDSHGLVDDDTVVVLPGDGSTTMPGGLTAGTVYYVVSATTDSFAVATAASGTAIDITSAQEVLISDIDPAVFAASADLTLASSGLTIAVY